MPRKDEVSHTLLAACLCNLNFLLEDLYWKGRVMEKDLESVGSLPKYPQSLEAEPEAMNSNLGLLWE